MKFKSRILVIEDDQQLCNSIRNVLSMKGYDICCTDNGISGIHQAFEYNPDLVLCAIRMHPVDGYHVYNVLKESSLIDRIPFIFMTRNAELRERRFAMNLGADDYFVKPFDNENLIQSIEKRLTKFEKLKEIGNREFRVLSNLTPNGIFFFDGNLIEANPAFLKMLNVNKAKMNTYSIRDFLTPDSFESIRDRINSCTHGLIDSFSESVTIVPVNGDKFEATLYISAYEKYSGYTLMAGLVALNSKKSETPNFLISDILKILRRENIVVTESLSEKLAGVLKHRIPEVKTQNNELFSERENQVLNLSMEGLPTKIIADKLSISARTVEKHRAKLMEKTNSKNMIEVIVFALRNNWITINSILLLAVFFVDWIDFDTIPFLTDLFEDFFTFS
jgi:DNA-binding NarL/FixJ family response regulator